MPRATRASKLFPMALSLSAACDALGVSRAALRRAVYVEATLAAYVGPNRSVRILVPDLCDWVRREWPRATLLKWRKKETQK
jgi:hypothetical protein